MSTISSAARALWATIKGETAEGANTAQRVGEAGEKLVDAIEERVMIDSGITPQLSETVQFTIGANTYTITDESAENITVQAIVTGSIDYGVLTADKSVKIINAGPAAITIDGTSVAAGVTAFAIFDLATGDWTISTVIDPIVPNYSDISVAQYTTTGVVLSPIGYYKIAAHGMGGTTAGNLIFVNNTAQQSAIGIYQALEGAGSGEIKAKKIATGIKLNVVRVASGAVYVSQYDGLNITSLKFSEMSTKEYAESLVVNIWKDKGNWNPAENANQYPIATGIKKGWLWVISGLGTGISSAMGAVTVQDGDTVRALVDNPGQTDSSWTTLENNLGYTPENLNNKTDDVETHKTSSVKFASVKGIVDWINARFAKTSGGNTFSGNQRINDLLIFGASGTSNRFGTDGNGLYMVTDSGGGSRVITGSQRGFRVTPGDVYTAWEVLGNGNITTQIGKYNFNAASPTADTTNDRKTSNIAGVKAEERCTSNNATKGGGNWVVDYKVLADGSFIQSMNILTAGTVETTYPLMRGKETNILNSLPTGVNSIFTIPAPEAGFKNESVVHFSVGASLPTLVYSGFTPKWLNKRALSAVANKSYTVVFEQVRTASGTWIVKASYGEY